MAAESSSDELTRAEIVAGLKALGVETGDVVMVHSSAAAFGKVAGGGNGVIDAILEAVGPEGTTVIPTFTGVAIEKIDRPVLKMVPYTGLIPAMCRKRPEFVKSTHPLYSVAAAGPMAEEIAELCDRYIFASAKGKFLWLMAERGGRVLLLGCTHKANSTIHLIEEFAGSDYKTQDKDYWDLTVEAFLALPREKQAELLDIHMGCCMDYLAVPHFDAIDAPLRRAGAIRTATIGKALCHQMKMADLLRIGAEEIAKDPWFLVDRVAKA